MLLKRVIAYMIDVFIVTLISTLIFSLPIFKDSYEQYVSYTNQQFEMILSGGSSDVDEEKLLSTEYNLNLASLPIYIIRLGVLLLYFGVLAYFLNGRTLGKLLFHLKVIDVTHETLNVHLFMLRCILVTSFIPNLLNVLCLKFGSYESWFIYSDIISILQSSFVFLMLGVAIFRGDGRGLHDMICHTAVVDTREK